MGTIINQVIAEWPKGTVKTAKELNDLGFYPQLIRKYIESKRIESVAFGIYKLYNDYVGWKGILYGIQKTTTSAIHAGGTTALELKGYGHYLRAEQIKVYLYSERTTRFPSWLEKIPNAILKRNKVFDYTKETYFTEHDAGGYKIKISSPELAAMEMLYLVPTEQGFDEAYQIMEGLTSLRPNLLQSLIESCTSIKVNRLFLYMAEKAGHGWYNRLNMDRVNLGSGKRMIIEGGVLNKKYNITIPKEYER